MTDIQAILADLNRAKVLFQRRAIIAALQLTTNPVKAAPLPAPLGAGDFPLPPAPDPLREGVEG